MIGNVFPMPEAPGAVPAGVPTPDDATPAGGPDFWSLLLVALSSRAGERGEAPTLDGPDLDASDGLEPEPPRPLEEVLRSLAEWQVDHVGSDGASGRSEPAGYGLDGLEVALDVVPSVSTMRASNDRVGARSARWEAGAIAVPTHAASGTRDRAPWSSTESVRPIASGESVTLSDVVVPVVRAPTASLDALATVAPASDLAPPVSESDLDVRLSESGVGPPVAEVDGAGTGVLRQPIDGPPDARTEGLAGHTPEAVDNAVRVDELDAPHLGVDTTIEATRPLTPAVVDVPDSTMAGLQPELRDKLERVIGRMRDEYGHDVEVVEGYRSKERQAHLYDQGRTRPGPIVTWTRSSLHGEGRAADVVIDGGYENKQAYARLQRVAGEEGLRNIGTRDAGHLELARERDAGARSGRLPTPLQERSGGHPVGVMRIAAVARVASVAAVARPGNYVARSAAVPMGLIDVPASVADDVTSSPRHERADDRNARVASLLPDKGGLVSTGSLDRSEGATVRALETNRSGRSGRAKDIAVTPNESSQVPHLASAPRQSAQLDAPRAVSASSGGVSTAEVTAALERVEQILEARELFRSTQPARISLNLGTGGPVSRLRVGLLGSRVDADLDLADGASKSLMLSRVSELHTALVDRGLELGKLGLNATSRLPAPAMESWMPSGVESAMEVWRSLLAGGSDSDREGAAQGRAPAEQQMKQNGAGSDRSGREKKKENDS